MSERNAIWNDLPPGLDERVLLAWVEDELSEAERGRVEAALRAHPALLGRLDAMRGDRLTLRSLGEERAPSHLLDSIEQTLERDALLGLANGEDLYSSPPVSLVRPRKNGWGMWTPALRGLALAAGVAVAAGVGLWLWPQLQSGGAPAPEEPGPLALADPAPETGPEAPAPIAPFAAPEPVVAEAPELPLETLIELPGPAPMGLERALALAGEGRLAIRVSSERFDVAWQRVSQLTDQPARARGWGLRTDDAGVATALLPRGADVAPGHGLLLDPGVMASRGDGARGAWTPPQIGSSQPDWDFGAERLGRSYIAHFALTEASLGALVDQLAAGGEVVLEELPAPLWVEGPVSADAVLWWGATASAAGQWGSAPVVVTPLE